MSQDNPYQPPIDDLPAQLKEQLSEAERLARLRNTNPVPDPNFWIVVAIGTAFLLLASALLGRLVFVMLFAWLGGTIRVCMVYSARARAALPPVNANLLLVTSTSICFTLQTVVVLLGLFVAWQYEWQPGTWVLAVFIGSVVLYIVMFLGSIRLAAKHI